MDMMTIARESLVLVVVVLFMRYLKDVRKDFTKTIENHLDHNTSVVSDNTKTINENTAVLTSLQVMISELKGWLSKNGGK